jgi:hypothetical protein
MIRFLSARLQGEDWRKKLARYLIKKGQALIFHRMDFCGVFHFAAMPGKLR